LSARTNAVPATAPGQAHSVTGPPGRRRLGLALLVIATAQLMVVLDATIVNVALPHIQRALGFSGANLEWVINAYALAFGGLLLLGGRAGDLLGRRKMFITGILLFSAASFWLSRIGENSHYATGLLGPTLVAGAGLGMLFMPLSLVALSRVQATAAGAASSLLNTGQQVGGSIGLALLGSVAWTAVANSIRVLPAVVLTA
jgi:MFS family permease